MRNPAVLGQWGKGKPRVPALTWELPYRWDRRAKRLGVTESVFPSMCDWLDPEVPTSWRSAFLEIIFETPHLRWMLLTKNPENFRQHLSQALIQVSDRPEKQLYSWIHSWLFGDPPDNVWYGVSVENQQLADERVPLLLQTPAAVRFLSVEPMLGPIDFGASFQNGGESMKGLNWAIFGGESGPGSRPCDIDWILSGVRQCDDANVPVFVKQLGSFAVTLTPRDWPDRITSYSPVKYSSSFRAGLKHKKGGDPSEWPFQLRRREFPEVVS